MVAADAACARPNESPPAAIQGLLGYTSPSLIDSLQCPCQLLPLPALQFVHHAHTHVHKTIHLMQTLIQTILHAPNLVTDRHPALCLLPIAGIRWVAVRRLAMVLRQ